MAKVLRLGAKVELVKPNKALDDPEILDSKLASSIQEIIDDDTIVISNPTIKARLIPMHSGERFDAYFFVGDKIYTARVSVVKNRTEGKIRTCEVTIQSSITKYERRQYFRFETNMNVRYLVLNAQNAAAFKEAVKSNKLLEMDGFVDGITNDISGGGIRYSSEEQLPAGGMVIVHLVANTPSGDKNYVFLGKVIRSEPQANIRGRFEHRMQFVDLKQDAREEFVQFIFHCERERLKNRTI